MKLFYTINSPYGRVTRIAATTCGIDFEPGEVKPTHLRADDNPVLDHNPTGRVPTLTDGDVVLTETRPICRYIEANGDGTKIFAYEGDWQAERIEGTAISLLDGTALWTRELRRPAEQQSDWLLGVESKRLERTLAWLDGQASIRSGDTPWDYAHMTLAVALEYIELRGLVADWRPGHDALNAWHAKHTSHPAMQAHPFVPGK